MSHLTLCLYSTSITLVFQTCFPHSVMKMKLIAIFHILGYKGKVISKLQVLNIIKIAYVFKLLPNTMHQALYTWYLMLAGAL